MYINVEMFRKVSHIFRTILLALVVQIANLSNMGARKAYIDQHEKQEQLRHVENELKQERQWNVDDASRLPLDVPSNYELNLFGKLEPASHLPTISLSSDRAGFKTRSGKCNGVYCGSKRTGD